MRFRFEDDGKEQMNQSNTRISNEESEITFKNGDSSLMQKSSCQSKSYSLLSKQRQVKDKLIQAVTQFQEDIDKEVKIQKLLKKEIQTLEQQKQRTNQQKLNMKTNNFSKSNKSKCQSESPIKIYQQQSIQVTQKGEQIKTQCNQNLKDQKVNSLKDEDNLGQEVKQPKKVIKNSMNARSIKSELLSKGYPVMAKTQGTKSSLPYRFRSN